MLARLRAILAHPTIETALTVALAAAAVSQLAKLVDRRGKQLQAMDTELSEMHARWQAACIAELDAVSAARVKAAAGDVDQAAVDEAAAASAAAFGEPVTPRARQVYTDMLHTEDAAHGRAEPGATPTL